MNPFPYSNDNKRYHTLHFYNKKHGIKAQKAVLNAGFTCPNIDGMKGVGGCAFCSGGSGYFTADPAVNVAKQLEYEIKRIRSLEGDAFRCKFRANQHFALCRLLVLSLILNLWCSKVTLLNQKTGETMADYSSLKIL